MGSILPWGPVGRIFHFYPQNRSPPPPPLTLCVNLGGTPPAPLVSTGTTCLWKTFSPRDLEQAIHFQKLKPSTKWHTCSAFVATPPPQLPAHKMYAQMTSMNTSSRSHKRQRYRTLVALHGTPPDAERLPNAAPTSLLLPPSLVQVLAGPVAVSGFDTTAAFTVPDDVACGAGPVGPANLVLGSGPFANGTCGGAERGLTDGQYGCAPSGSGPWQSCGGSDDYVTLSTGPSRCVRSVRVWPCAGNRSALAGTWARVFTAGGWRDCEATPAPDPATGAYEYPCALVGTRVGLWLVPGTPVTLSEVEVLGQERQCGVATVDVPGCRPVVVAQRTYRVAGSALRWTIAGACPRIATATSALPPDSLTPTPVCLAPGAYQFVASGPAGPYPDAFAVALLDGSSPIVPWTGLQHNRLNRGFTIPVGRACDQPTVGLGGCWDVTVNLNTTASAGQTGFHIEAACPPYGRNRTEIQPNTNYSFTVCLKPGSYTLVATDLGGDGWAGGTYSLELQPPHSNPNVPGSNPKAVIILPTEVAGFGLRAAFNVPTAAPDPAGPWHSVHGGRWYINLPATDNWSEFHPLSTTWQRLRVQVGLARGQRAVWVDLTDLTYTTSNGRRGPAGARDSVAWGVAADCRGGGNASAYRLNLEGTPFRVPPGQPAVAIGGSGASGGAACDANGTRCWGSCGGRCGWCGFGFAPPAQLVKLLVTDVHRFDSAFPVNCGPPARAHVDFGACDHHQGGRCAPQCVAPYSGQVTAVCNASGLWTYSGVCTLEATAYATGLNGAGQLALGRPGDAEEPQPMAVSSGRAIVAVAAGGWHTAIMTEAAVYVAGSNRDGQLGLGPGPDRFAPQPLRAPSADDPIAAMALGNAHTAFVTRSGRAYAMGSNAHGQLGLGPGVAARDVPHPVALPRGDAVVTRVAAGPFATALLTAPGPGTPARAYVMGLNRQAQLGLGDTRARYGPQRLEAPDGSAITAVALGRSHTVFLAGGRCYVVGSNAKGQLGLGTATAQYVTPQVCPPPPRKS